MNTDDLRKASAAAFLATDEAIATDLSAKLKWAADEIDRLRKNSTSQPSVETDTKIRMNCAFLDEACVDCEEDCPCAGGVT